MRVSSFFAGIGGFDLGLERAGMNVVFQCELDPFCQQILKRHWPHVPLHDDITTLKPATIPAADLWCAGWPCQDLSTANTERAGLSGKRSGLFFTFMDLVREVRPAWLVMENVPGLLSAEQGTALETVIDTLEANGYLGGWVSCNAVDSGLPHHRDRVFFIASFRSERAYHFFTDSSELSGDTCENRAKRKLDPIFVKSLSETIRLWYNVAVASGIPWQKASAPRYAPKLEDIKAAIQTDRYSVARNLTWTEWERLMGFPPGWTVAEGDSLAMLSSPPSANGLEDES
jgi:site-specific DNA-cytosine methylase